MLVTTLVQSRLMHNVGNWAWPDKRAVDRLAVVYMDALRAIVMGPRAQYGDQHPHISDARVLKVTKRPPMEALVRMARIRMFARVVKHGPPVLLQLLRVVAPVQGSWVSCVCADLRFVWSSSGKLQDLPDPNESLHEWAHGIRQSSRILVACWEML
eukprot:13704399-Alexandrium_andersonii.AAC.1